MYSRIYVAGWMNHVLIKDFWFKMKCYAANAASTLREFSSVNVTEPSHSSCVAGRSGSHWPSMKDHHQDFGLVLQFKGILNSVIVSTQSGKKAGGMSSVSG